MTPASSKYDAYVRGQATLTEQEVRGLEVFKDRRRGACSGLPPPGGDLDQPGGVDVHRLRLRRGRAARATARCRRIATPPSFDLGLCERKGAKTPASDEKWCSNFRTPSLRNVAVRESFGHNGVYKTLREVVAFYAQRAVAPGRIYPPGQTFDDVPPEVSRQRQHLRPRSTTGARARRRRCPTRRSTRSWPSCERLTDAPYVVGGRRRRRSRSRRRAR